MCDAPPDTPLFASNSVQNEIEARLSIGFSAKGSIVSLVERSLSLVALKYTGFTSHAVGFLQVHCSSRADTAAKRNACPNACAVDFGEPKKNKHDETMHMQFAEISVQMSCRSFLKFQVTIISLGTLYSINLWLRWRVQWIYDYWIDLKQPGTAAPAGRLTCLESSANLNLQQVETTKALPLDDLSRAVSANDQRRSDHCYLIFVETWNSKVCMSLCVWY